MRKVLAAAVSALLTLAACGGGNDDERAKTLPASPTSAAQDGTTATESAPKAINAMLLRVSDLPTGYSEKAPEPDEDEDDSPALCREFENVDEIQSESKGEKAFSKGEASLFGGAELSQEVYIFKSREEISDRLGLFLKIMENPECRTFETIDEDGATIKGTMSALSFPKLGDATIAMHMAAEVSSEGIDLPVAMNLVVFRKGRALNVLNTIGFGASMIPATELERIARKALDKM